MQDPATLQTARAVLAPARAPEAEPEITTKQLTQLQLVWLRFRRHKPAMVGSAVILFMVVIALLATGPQVMPESPYNMFSYDITNQNRSCHS